MGLDNKESIITAAATAGIIGTMAATVRALLSNNENIWQKLRTLAAGIIMSVLVGLILRNTSLTELWKEIIVGICGAFVSSFWPLLEKQVNKFIKKKTDVISNTDIS